MRIVVTGGAGFVGAPTVHRLAAQGHDVHVIDNLARGTRARLDLAARGPMVHLHEADIRDRARIVQVFDEAVPHAVVHLAANHFIPDCMAHPADTLEINVLGTQNVLEAADRASVEALFFASTADVYRPATAPHREPDALAPGNVYGLSKLVAEMLIAQWHAMLARRCRVVVGRLFNVYGPGDTNPHVLPEIVQQLRRGNVLRLGNVAPRRDYVWVDDVALAIASLVGTSAARRDHSITTVNVGTGVSTCVEEIVERLASVTGRALSIDTDPERVRESDRPNLQADTSRFRALYGHALPTALEDGLRILVEAEGFA